MPIGGMARKIHDGSALSAPGGIADQEGQRAGDSRDSRDGGQRGCQPAAICKQPEQRGWLNAASFAAVVTSLLIMDRSALRPSPPSGRASGQLREGLRYAARTPTIAIPLAMMGLVGLFAYEFSVSLPVLAERSFHGGAEAYGFMTAAMGSAQSSVARSPPHGGGPDYAR